MNGLSSFLIKTMNNFFNDTIINLAAQEELCDYYEKLNFNKKNFEDLSKFVKHCLKEENALDKDRNVPKDMSVFKLSEKMKE